LTQGGFHGFGKVRIRLLEPVVAIMSDFLIDAHLRLTGLGDTFVSKYSDWKSFHAIHGFKFD
jgi:hypothetical protein